MDFQHASKALLSKVIRDLDGKEIVGRKMKLRIETGGGTWVAGKQVQGASPSATKAGGEAARPHARGPVSGSTRTKIEIVGLREDCEAARSRVQAFKSLTETVELDRPMKLDAVCVDIGRETKKNRGFRVHPARSLPLSRCLTIVSPRVEAFWLVR